MGENTYGQPGVGLFQNQYDTELGEAEGFIFIEVHDSNGGPKDLVFIIQGYSIQKTERVQEVLSLADTSHLYTFGKVLPRLTFNGMFINSILCPKGHAQYVDQVSEDSTSETILQLWEDAMRAKSIGLTGGTVGPEGIFPVSVDLHSLKRTFFGVGADLNLSNTITMESMIPASFTLIIMKEQSL